MTSTRDDLNAFLDYPPIDVPHAATGPLAGLTLGVKDIYDVAGHPTGGGNPEFPGALKMATATAPSVQKLLDAGARYVGKTQTEELTFSLMGQNVHFPHPVNPKARDRVTGGSSSGSAAAVAGGLCDIATASDTGGSVRGPASFCGLIGLRATHGRLSLEKAMPLAPSLDVFGWYAKDATTYEKVADVMLGEASVTLPAMRPLRLASFDALVLGPDEAAEYARMVAVVESVLGAAKEAPALSFSVDELYSMFRRIQAYEAWAVHGDFVSKTRNMDPAVRARFEFGKTLGCEVATQETKKRSEFRAELEALLGENGLLILPTMPGAAPKSASTGDQLLDYRERALRLLCLSGLSGLPQITIPLGTVHGAPFGISLIGPRNFDRALVALATRIMDAA
ncbi:amidase [Aliihoeflea sp. 40Bstr573]|uniref:amidase n=1 Tax=Aliihoeflea sp. 40Bstr573 TaxID=2696467 RepID=UPI00209621BD|nr:amidase [Aliihoeflea sp. 40Bstr573]MCO6386570.1 amidase [Aliihoeflea sp. 40Bstr573]